MLEVGGDALIRGGLHGTTVAITVAMLIAGAAVLFAYGVTVNLPPWNFGRLLGVYVALFFLVAQAVNYLFFGAAPTPSVLLGGALIMAGGAVVAAWGD